MEMMGDPIQEYKKRLNKSLRQPKKKKIDSSKKTIRPNRKKGSSTFLPNLKEIREEAKKKANRPLVRRGKSPGALGGKTRGVSPGALGGKAKTPSMVLPKKRPSSIKPTEKFSSFGAAFKAARKRLGAGKTFTYKGKKYSTNTKADLTKKKITGKKRIDPFAITSRASKSGIDGASFTSKKKKVKAKGRFTEPVDRKVNKKKNVMSTKDRKTFKGTNITPTKLQRDRMRKRKLAST